MKRRRKQKKQEVDVLDIPEQDETFYYIAGYTSGGMPYGITWEEMELEDDLSFNEDDASDVPF